MYMDDLQFNELCSRLGFTQGPLTYSDFAEAFEDLRIWGPGAEIQHMPNHDPIRLEAQSMSAEEVEPVLKDKMRQGFGVSLSPNQDPIILEAQSMNAEEVGIL